MGRLEILRRLWRNRDALLPFLELLKRAVKAAVTLEEIRQKIKDGIDEGDLDEAVARFKKANARADEYVDTGR